MLGMSSREFYFAIQELLIYTSKVDWDLIIKRLSAFKAVHLFNECSIGEYCILMNYPIITQCYEGDWVSKLWKCPCMLHLVEQGVSITRKYCIAGRFQGLQFLWFLLNLKNCILIFLSKVKNWGMVYSLLPQFSSHLSLAFPCMHMQCWDIYIICCLEDDKHPCWLLVQLNTGNVSYELSSYCSL